MTVSVVCSRVDATATCSGVNMVTAGAGVGTPPELRAGYWDPVPRPSWSVRRQGTAGTHPRRKCGLRKGCLMWSRREGVVRLRGGRSL